jgi:hypothetical protein
MKKGLFALPEHGKGLVNHTHVDNLIDAIFQALASDARGTFNVTDGETMSCAAYFGCLAGWLGRTVPTYRASSMRQLFRVTSWFESAMGRTPMAHPAAVDFLLRPGAYSIEKARKQLGYVPRVPREAGLLAVRAWLESTGELPDAGTAALAEAAMAKVPAARSSLASMRVEPIQGRGVAGKSVAPSPARTPTVPSATSARTSESVAPPPAGPVSQRPGMGSVRPPPAPAPLGTTEPTKTPAPTKRS